MCKCRRKPSLPCSNSTEPCGLQKHRFILPFPVHNHSQHSYAVRISLKNVHLSVEDKTILHDIDFHADEGEFIYLTGVVGAGKSSLLKIIYGEAVPSGQGEARVLDFDLYRLKSRHLPLLRRQIGIVFQDFRLLTERTVYDNLDFVLRAIGWRKKAQRQARIGELLTLVGMESRADAWPHQLSGGEQQRICIARALAGNPKIILADEPTANLDSENANFIMSLLRHEAERGATVITVTHNNQLLQQFPGIVYTLHEGRLSDSSAEDPQGLTAPADHEEEGKDNAPHADALTWE